MEEEILPAVLLPNMVGEETFFSALNLEEAILQRADLEGPGDYLLGGSGTPRSGDSWMLKMVAVIYSVRRIRHRNIVSITFALIPHVIETSFFYVRRIYLVNILKNSFPSRFTC